MGMGFRWCCLLCMFSSTVMGEFPCSFENSIQPSQLCLKRDCSKKYKPLKILMLLWQNLTKTEKSFLKKLETMGYSVESTIENLNRDQKYLRQVLKQKYDAADYDYIYSSGTLTSILTSEWAKKQNTPLVFNTVHFPIKTGLITDDEHNGGNLAGVEIFAPISSQLDQIQKIIPIDRLAIIVNSDEQSSLDAYNECESYCNKNNKQLERFDIKNNDDIKNFIKLSKENLLKNDAILVASNEFNEEQATQFFKYTNKHKIITIVGQEAMLTYGANFGVITSCDEAGTIAAEIIYFNQKKIKMNNIPLQSGTFEPVFNEQTMSKEHLDACEENGFTSLRSFFAF